MTLLTSSTLLSLHHLTYVSLQFFNTLLLIFIPLFFVFPFSFLLQSSSFPPLFSLIVTLISFNSYLLPSLFELFSFLLHHRFHCRFLLVFEEQHIPFLGLEVLPAFHILK